MAERPGFVQIFLPLMNTLMGERHYYPIHAAAGRHGPPTAVHPNSVDAIYTKAAPLAGGVPPHYVDWHAAHTQILQANVISLACHWVFERFPKLNGGDCRRRRRVAGGSTRTGRRWVTRSRGSSAFRARTSSTMCGSPRSRSESRTTRSTPERYWILFRLGAHCCSALTIRIGRSNERARACARSEARANPQRQRRRPVRRPARLAS